MRSAQINQAVVGQRALARNFDKTTIAASGAAGGADVAVELRAAVGPYGDCAAIALIDGIDADVCIRTHDHLRGIGLGTGTMEIATDDHLATARAACRIDAGRAKQADLVAQYGHCTAGLAGIFAAGIDRTRDADHTRRSAVDDDLAVAFAQGLGAHDAIHVDDGIEQGIGRTRRQQHLAAVGRERAGVGDAGVGRSRIDRQGQQAVAGEVERHAIARTERDRAQPGSD